MFFLLISFFFLLLLLLLMRALFVCEFIYCLLDSLDKKGVEPRAPEKNRENDDC